MEESICVRTSAGLDLRGPLDVYALCERLGIAVQFVTINMEGLYKRGRSPRILLSALRPAARRVFTCAHELGHHTFGHGFTIDQILEGSTGEGILPPEEFLAQAFAGFLLMPTLGARKAFVERGWSAATATPAQLYAVACSFGVGYTTLINHLAYGLEMLSDGRARDMVRVPVARIRREMLGQSSTAPLVLADEYWLLPTIDIEVGSQLLLPDGVEIEGGKVESLTTLSSGRLYRACQPGIARALWPRTGRALFVRIARRAYVGLARYRHLEDEEPDEEEGGLDNAQ